MINNHLINILILANSISPQVVPLIFAVGVLVIPVIVLAIYAFVKFLIKYIKRSRKVYDNKPVLIDKYLSNFGEDNIISTSRNMNRVTIEVKDINLVNFDGLRALNVGILIAGNVVKCSSAEFAELISQTESDIQK